MAFILLIPGTEAGPAFQDWALGCKFPNLCLFSCFGFRNLYLIHFLLCFRGGTGSMTFRGRYDLCDEEDALLQPLLPSERSSKAGYPWRSHRQMLNGIRCWIRSGSGAGEVGPASALPPSPATKATRFPACAGRSTSGARGADRP